MCSAHKTAPVTGNISEAAIIHVCLLLSGASLTVTVIGLRDSHLCSFAKPSSFLESSLPLAPKHVQAFFHPLESKSRPTSVVILPCSSVLWNTMDRTTLSTPLCAILQSGTGNGRRLSELSGNSGGCCPSEHLREREVSSFFLWNKLNDHT